MKVAITGKGGVGKTTLASTLARLYADEGRTVLAADVDPDANLGLALGLTEEEVNSIVPVSKMKQLAKQRTFLNVRKKKRKKLFDALATEEALAMSKALYEEGLSGMESEYAQYAEAKATLDTCGFSRQILTEEKADIYEQLAQINKQIRAERQKIKLCRAIADSAAVMQRDVAAQEKSPHEKETEHLLTNRR